MEVEGRLGVNSESSCQGYGSVEMAKLGYMMVLTGCQLLVMKEKEGRQRIFQNRMVTFLWL